MGIPESARVALGEHRVQRRRERQEPWTNPVEGPVRSEYGRRRDPFTGEQQFHTGMDVSVPEGTQIIAASSGTVVTGESPVFGQFVAINPDSRNPNGNMRIITGHMSATNVTNGVRVQRGTILGLSGNTGLSTGPHVDLMVRTDGQDYPDGAGNNTVNPRQHFRYP